MMGPGDFYDYLFYDSSLIQEVMLVIDTWQFKIKYSPGVEGALGVSSPFFRFLDAVDGVEDDVGVDDGPDFR